VRVHVGALAQICVHNLPLGRPHRLELHWPVVAQRLRGGAVRHSVQRRRAALAVAGRVHGHLLARLRPAEGGAEHEMLERIDRRPVLADQ
jgi:hypothetical protein